MRLALGMDGVVEYDPVVLNPRCILTTWEVR